MKFFENIFQAILSLFGRSNKHNNTDTSANISSGMSPADYTSDAQQSSQHSSQGHASGNPGATASLQPSQNITTTAQPIQPNAVAPSTGVASVASVPTQGTPAHNEFSEPAPGTYDGFPDAPNPDVPTYGGFPTYDGFPSTDTPTYGGFPIEDTPTYGGFPDNGTYSGFPETGTYAGFPNAPESDAPTYGGFPTYDGFPSTDTPTYGGFPTYAGFPPSSDYGNFGTANFEVKPDGTYVGIVDDTKETQGGWGSPASDTPADPTSGVISVDNNKDTDPLSIKDGKQSSQS